MSVIEWLVAVRFPKKHAVSDHLSFTNCSANADPIRACAGFFPDKALIEAHQNRLKYRLPRDRMTLGQIFTLIEQHRAALKIDEVLHLPRSFA